MIGKLWVFMAEPDAQTYGTSRASMVKLAPAPLTVPNFIDSHLSGLRPVIK